MPIQSMGLCLVDTKHPLLYEHMEKCVEYSRRLYSSYPLQFSTLRTQGLFPVNSHLTQALYGLIVSAICTAISSLLLQIFSLFCAVLFLIYMAASIIAHLVYSMEMLVASSDHLPGIVLVKTSLLVRIRF